MLRRTHSWCGGRGKLTAAGAISFAWVALVLAGGSAGCGDDVAEAPDAAVTFDAAPLVDAQGDAPVPTDGACALEFERCDDKDDPAAYCIERGLECVSVRIDRPIKVCLRRCSDTRDCPYSSYCVPSTVEFGGLILAAHHCYSSVCGQSYGNGELFGGCSVGGDNLVSLDGGQQRPGTCVPVDSDAGTGICLETGSEYTGDVAARNGLCTFDQVAAGCPPREEIVGCAPGTTCVGVPGDSLGYCRLLCDPRLDPVGSCTLTPESPKQHCQDLSRVTVGASGVTHVGYVGVCQDLARCRLPVIVGDGGVPLAECPDEERCHPTTMVTINGVCAPAGGAVEGEPCQSPVECAPGRECLDLAGDAGVGACYRLCARFDGGVGCEPGARCQLVNLEPGEPDVEWMPWGVCVASPDGGV